MIYVFVGIGVPLGAVVNGIFILILFYFLFIYSPVSECRWGWWLTGCMSVSVDGGLSVPVSVSGTVSVSFFLCLSVCLSLCMK